MRPKYTETIRCSKDHVPAFCTMAWIIPEHPHDRIGLIRIAIDTKQILPASDQQDEHRWIIAYKPNLSSEYVETPDDEVGEQFVDHNNIRERILGITHILLPRNANDIKDQINNKFKWGRMFKWYNSGRFCETTTPEENYCGDWSLSGNSLCSRYGSGQNYCFKFFLINKNSELAAVLGNKVGIFRPHELDPFTPAGQLEKLYVNYIIAKKCYDSRRGYVIGYINEPEMEDARTAMRVIEDALKPKIADKKTDDIWKEANQSNRANNLAEDLARDYNQFARSVCRGNLKALRDAQTKFSLSSQMIKKDF